MCGISGIIKDKKSNTPGLENQIKKMTVSLKHRGPDNSGIWIDNDNSIALGHQRLSILDLSAAGNQPMEFSECKFVISFNGEIYNHLEIRREIERDSKKIINWISNTDTETLIRAFEIWGTKETLKKCSGMFSIALWDKSRKILTLARDRFGEKPLYFGWVNKNFVFASELKAIKKVESFHNRICKKALSQYLSVNYVPSPLSIYENIFKLEPGTFVEIDNSIRSIDQIKIHKYWSIHNIIQKVGSKKINHQNMSINELENVLFNSVKSQMLSDVPLGAFLSGGVDSSLICALMQKDNLKPIDTYTVGFQDKQFDESKYANKVAKHLGTNHNEIIVSENDCQKIIPYLPEIYDEPFADSSQIPTYLICKAAKQNVTVALSGDGGDEIFGGYNRYTWSPKIWNKISTLPFFLRKKVAYLCLNISEKKFDFLFNIFINKAGFKIHKIAKALKSAVSLETFMQKMIIEWEGCDKLVLNYNQDHSVKKFLFESKIDKLDLNFKDPISKMMYLDSVTYLTDDILCKLDRAAMFNSLETRVPFLNEKVVEFAWNMPLSKKIKNGVGKWPLKNILSNYLPQNLINRPKTGFAVPLGKWLKGPLRNWSENLLDEKRLAQEGNFSAGLVRDTWKEHLDGKRDHSSKLWSILMFQAWYEKQ